MSAGVRECGSGYSRGLPRALAAALVPLLLGGCGAGCADEVVQHEPSPYGRGTAIVFVRECGATAEISTQVAILGHVDAAPRDRSVVFVAEPGSAPSGSGGPAVRVRWIDGNHVEIAHHPRARTSRKAVEHGPIRITYAALP